MQLAIVASRAEEGVEYAAALAHQLFAGFAENSPGHRRSDGLGYTISHLLAYPRQRTIGGVAHSTFDRLSHPRERLFDSLCRCGSNLQRHFITRCVDSSSEKA